MILMPYPLILQARDGLRKAGLTVEPADIPGLYNVSGCPELTSAQVIDLARQVEIEAGVIWDNDRAQRRLAAVIKETGNG